MKRAGRAAVGFGRGCDIVRAVALGLGRCSVRRGRRGTIVDQSLAGHGGGMMRRRLQALAAGSLVGLAACPQAASPGPSARPEASGQPSPGAGSLAPSTSADERAPNGSPATGPSPVASSPPTAHGESAPPAASTWLSPDDRCPADVGHARRPASACVDAAGWRLWTPPIDFLPDRAVFVPASLPVVDAVAAFLARYPAIARLRVEGHLGDPDAEAYGRRLDRDRAAAVVQRLVEQGVARERLEYRGFGNDQPIAPPRAPEGRRLNRRIEFVVLVPTPVPIASD